MAHVSMHLSTSMLYGVFVTEKSYLIGIRELVMCEHASLLAWKVCAGRVPMELTIMIEKCLAQFERETIMQQYNKYSEEDREYRLKKFSFQEPHTEGQKFIFAKLQTMGVSTMLVDNDRPYPGHKPLPARAYYVHLSAVKTRPAVSIQLPSGSTLRQQAPPSLAYRALDYLTNRGGMMAACGMFISRCVFREEGLRMDQLSYYRRPKSKNPKTPEVKDPTYTARLLQCEGVAEAIAQWDDVALRQFVNCLDLQIVPYNEKATYEPGLHIWQQILETR